MPSVRAAAAQAFDSLQEHLGGKAVDQTIPTLLEALRQPGESSGTALQALKEVIECACASYASSSRFSFILISLRSARTRSSLCSFQHCCPRL